MASTCLRKDPLRQASDRAMGPCTTFYCPRKYARSPQRELTTHQDAHLRCFLPIIVRKASPHRVAYMFKPALPCAMDSRLQGILASFQISDLHMCCLLTSRTQDLGC